jgi:hypothetical protein
MDTISEVDRLPGKQPLTLPVLFGAAILLFMGATCLFYSASCRATRPFGRVYARTGAG